MIAGCPLFTLALAGLFLTPTLSLNCSSTNECVQFGREGEFCSAAGVCQCEDSWILKAGSCMRVLGLNSHCKTDSECKAGQRDSYCSKLLNICMCRQGFITLEDGKNKPVSCQVNVVRDHSTSTFIDPTMIGILVVLALMFIVICVILQMFSKAQFAENRSIFNTPNPRLMNASMVKGGGITNMGSELDTPARPDYLNRKNSRVQQKTRARVVKEESMEYKNEMV